MILRSATALPCSMVRVLAIRRSSLCATYADPFEDDAGTAGKCQPCVDNAFCPGGAAVYASNGYFPSISPTGGVTMIRCPEAGSINPCNPDFDFSAIAAIGTPPSSASSFSVGLGSYAYFQCAK